MSRRFRKSYKPQLCVCFLWCLRFSAPGLLCPALWGAARDSHSPPETTKPKWQHGYAGNKSTRARLVRLQMSVALLFCSVWYSCVLWLLSLPIFWLLCSDCAPPSCPSRTPADGSVSHTRTTHDLKKNKKNVRQKHTRVQRTVRDQFWRCALCRSC